MVAQGKAEAVISRMQQVSREMTERRALRERSAEAAKQQSTDSLQAQGKVAEKMAKHLGELGRRQKSAGGWATEKTMTEDEHVMGLGVQQDENASDDLAQLSGRAPVTPAGPQHASPQHAGGQYGGPQHGGPQHGGQTEAAPAQEGSHQQEPVQERKHSRSVAPKEPEPEPAPEPPRRPAPRRARPHESFDDDDFSNNSWMR